MSATDAYLPAGLPAPASEALDETYWSAATDHRLMIQCCQGCGRHQWGPEWICNKCRSFDLEWVEVEPRGVIYSWERIWHPVHPALVEACPYVVVLVELPHADGVRMVGNLLGDPTEEVQIGSEVEGVFEDHPECEPPYTLVQWRRLP
ncbi:MAG: OB-fold domain-containing protein [Acidimicrobiales bacterium]|nr:OB-fold domain-containing protein [Acidimicrobiales bacterium]